MRTYDDDLTRFEADGADPVPVTEDQGYVDTTVLGSGTSQSKAPARLAGVFFFASNMDSSGVKQITEVSPLNHLRGTDLAMPQRRRTRATVQSASRSSRTTMMPMTLEIVDVHHIRRAFIHACPRRHAQPYQPRTSPLATAA